MSKSSAGTSVPTRGGGTTWRSWGGNLTVKPAALVRPGNSDELEQVLRDASARGLRVRPVGSGHSFSPLVCTPDVLLDTSGLAGLCAIDVDRQRITVFGGTTVQQVARMLEAHGLALANMADSHRQTVAGAIATGTHGTGLGQPSLAEQMIALTLLTPSGELLTCSETSHPEILRAARSHLGVLGVVVSVTLQCVSAFRLHCSEFREPVAGLMETMTERMAGADHFEFFWTPGTSAAHTRVLSRLHRLPEVYTRPHSPFSRALRRADDAVLRTSLPSGLNRLASAVPRAVPGVNKLESMAISSRHYTDVSYRVFTTPRPVKFVMCEYALPLENTPAAFRELKKVVDRDGYTTSFPVLVRCSPPEQGYLSPAAGRYTGWIALRHYGKRPYREFFATAERIFLEHGGRPHWGTVHSQDASTLAPLYPRWDEFRRIRSALDPEGLLLTDHAREVLGL